MKYKNYNAVKAEVFEYAEAGLPACDIANHLDTSVSVIRRIVHQQPAPTPRKFSSDAERESAKRVAEELFTGGLDYEAVAERIGVSPITIRRWLEPAFARELGASDNERRANAKAQREQAKLGLLRASLREFLAGLRR